METLKRGMLSSETLLLLCRITFISLLVPGSLGEVRTSVWGMLVPMPLCWMHQPSPQYELGQIRPILPAPGCSAHKTTSATGTKQ